MSFIASLREAREQARKTAKDPWHLRLEGLRGKTWDDGIERIRTQTVSDILEVPHNSHTAGACRRLSKLMRGSAGTRSRRGGLRREGFATKCADMPETRLGRP